MLVTVFPSPTTTSAFAAPFRGQRFWPITSLPDQPVLPPVRPFCSATDIGSPRFRPLRCFWPVAVSPTRPTGLFSNLHSPSGLLHPSRSKRSAGLAACQSAFRFRPISSRSPQPVSITSVSAADHRSWSATFPEACCSSNLLEPFSLCSRKRFWSTTFVREIPLFLRIYYVCFEWITARLREFAVDKTNGRSLVLC
jgi:hypothetical protein